MTIRELLFIMIDASDKDKPVKVEYRQEEMEQNNNGYEWNELEVTNAVACGGGLVIEAHPERLRELMNRREEEYLTIEQIATAVGPRTIHSARLWIEFARTLEYLGYAVVKRRPHGTQKGNGNIDALPGT